jgi:predicted metalloprotease
MDWGKFRRSGNVVDQRGGGGFGRGAAVGGGGLIIALIASLLFGVNPSVVLDQLGGGSGTTQQAPAAPNDTTADFVRAVLGDTEDTWSAVFKKNGKTYEPPTLVLFSGVVNTACGTGQTASGPFYCPNDRRVYLDTDFFRELDQSLGAPGDFARAYVIAHEVGHHVQNLLGTLPKVDQQRARASETTANALSVRLELQADCYAGIWGNGTRRRDLVDNADLNQAVTAAAAIGDDALQRASQGEVVPDSFTHGSSAQRVQWLKTGLDSGSLQACDTFR